MAEQKGAAEVDYTRLKVKDAILTSIWGVVITPYVFYILYTTFLK